MKEYKEILKSEYGYTDYLAQVTARDMEAMDQECKDYFEAGPQNEADLVFRDFSVRGLMKDFGMYFPAAVLAISQLKTNYKALSKLLKSGIK